MTTHANRSSDRGRGFTLIEVLAALVIVALGMMGVIEAVTQSARNGTYLREKTLAHWIAMNVITERRLEPSPPEIGESSDEVEFAGTRWKWTLRVTQTQLPSMRRMDVLVRTVDAPAESSLITVSGFYGTGIGAAGAGTVPWANAGTGGGQAGAGDAEEERAPRTPKVRPQRTPPVTQPKNPPPDDDV
jgi:general secretion pathway protein I